MRHIVRLKMSQALRYLLLFLFPRTPIRCDRVVMCPELKLGQMALLQLSNVDGAVGAAGVPQTQRPRLACRRVVACRGRALERRVAPRSRGTSEGCHLRPDVPMLNVVDHFRACVLHGLAGRVLEQKTFFGWLRSSETRHYRLYVLREFVCINKPHKRIVRNR